MKDVEIREVEKLLEKAKQMLRKPQGNEAQSRIVKLVDTAEDLVHEVTVKKIRQLTILRSLSRDLGERHYKLKGGLLVFVRPGASLYLSQQNGQNGFEVTDEEFCVPAGGHPYQELCEAILREIMERIKRRTCASVSDLDSLAGLEKRIAQLQEQVPA